MNQSLQDTKSKIFVLAAVIFSAVMENYKIHYICLSKYFL